MHIINLHRRTFDLPKDQFLSLYNTLSSEADGIWPKEKWPKMRLNNGLSIGSKGGHGPIRYYIESHIPSEQTVFRFTKPHGFDGVHKFDINALENNKTELVHTLDIHAKGKALLLWHSGVRWLHDALIEDGFDKIHNKITKDSKETKWNIWVRILRSILK